MSVDTSKGSDIWNDSSNWSGGAPTSTTDARIKPGTDVTLTGSASLNALTVATKGGILTISGGVLTTTSGITDNGLITGYGVINGAIGGDGDVVTSGGTLELTGSVGADGNGLTLDIGSGTTLKLDGVVDDSVSLSFSGSNEILDLSGEGTGTTGEVSDFQTAVSNFGSGDAIVVAGASSGDTVKYNASTHELTVWNSSHQIIDELALSGNYKKATFSITHNNATGADTITTNAICFMAGVMIRTPDGEVPVETLKRGDLVLTSDGVAKPVTWLGRQTISTLFADPERTWPIRVKAGALSETTPSRDLIVSPDHALLVDGILIQAGALVNGTSIAREFTVPRTFVYYHVELDDHSLVLAENTPAETFIDNAERLAFDNWEEHEALYPEGKPIPEMPYARAKGPRQVPVRIRAALAERASKLGLLTAEVA